MINQYLKLNDVFINWKTGGGIFNGISGVSGYSPPWNSEVESTILDILYHGNNSGNKIVSPILNNFINFDTIPPNLSSDDIKTISKVIVGKYSKRWLKLWNTLTLDYNPISNYDMTETSNDSETNTGTVVNEGSITHGENIKLTNKKILDNTVNATQNQDTYGFNSTNSIPSDKQTGTNTGHSQENLDNNEVHSGNDTNSNTLNNNLKKAIEHNLHREGNIGVTTSQQMIQSERDLWIWQYFDVIFSDIDAILTIQIY